MITSLRELGMALAVQPASTWMRCPTASRSQRPIWQDAGIVVLLPTYDYPSEPDEGWSQAELDALTDYVEDGGLLVVTNSEIAHIMTVPGSNQRRHAGYQ